ncbi:2-keto-4-pentenoate hydratase/2-oxohepta-3-ene-1,7-dioic acid hydratase in catechol pathway [Homoserinimonas aerilata]|uniref:2-keto-4-pentenoate hydratase/2-oxohepta-3-ene-1,7-dioic acid hydratase in catechol pathway n=1 Tax=Homoserinimonas aerilata TaxID=1162970 RepID=A0A542YK20_9MICO|nr:fumarylacetoacetate hydrolase family protein [Homoserinimonas aerilata]TQL48415.1 2-keto-4-pentenoate hydratase/2-oxohepta-3-ene-1,7-dioic acid hydratase in catechol pathway [Homoserinimonas aerilata]
MKIARYEHNGFPHVGIVNHGKVNSLPDGTDVLETLNLPLDAQYRLQASAGRHHRVPLEDVRFLPPIEPRAMRDFVAFEAHITGMKKAEPGDGSVPEAWYEAPAFLFMNPWSLTAPGADIPMPPLTKALDYEVEVAAIVGTAARDVTPEQAREHIVGYAIFNDWSARDIQGREMQVGLGPSKGKDFANTLGPWITTPDELEKFRLADGRLDLEMSVTINGVQTGSDRLSNLSWTFEELVSHASRDAWVGAGDVLATGTCASGSLAELWGRAGRQDPPPLTVGDVISITVQGLGTLTNRISPQTSTGVPVPPAWSRRQPKESP